MQKKILLTLFAILILQTSRSQSFYQIDSIQKIEIFFSNPNWDYMMDTAKYGADNYTPATWVKINGIQYDSVGVKYKGNSSYDSTKIKNPFHIELNTYTSQNHQGYKDIKLSNAHADPSIIREILAYQILKNYMHCPSANFAEVYVNGNYIGIYSNIESINKKFCGDHFASSNGNFFKCNPATSPGPTSKSNFKYLGVDSNLYMPLYELKSKIGWNDFVKLCDSITNNPSSYENILNVDRIIWMLAFNNVFVNLDSYNGVFAQNHYIYKDQTNLYNPIIWDLNMCFGGFPFAGAGNASMGSLSLTALQQLSPANHANDDYWPLIKAIQSNDTYRRKYIAHIKTILNEFVATNQYNTLATQYRTLIDAAVSDDTNKKFTYADFQNAMNTDISIGNYDVPGISNLLNGRMAYLLSLPEFTNAAPSVSNISASNPNPTYNSSIYITANISNATDATLGFRFSSFSNFQKISMYDDGQHGDGVANDGVYGAEVAMTGASLEYYIYSENSGAGIFSPARAEHEFYTLTVSNTMPTQGSIVINEILSENKTGVVDEYNDQEDWIELYNTTNETIAMDNVYLSNDVTNPLKWKFPANTYILPHGYIVAFADKDTIKKGLHTNFKVSKDADFVSLSTSSFLLDSISLFLQTTDVSYGRYPNGTGNFQKMNTTFGYENNNYPLNVINFTQSTNDLIVYPNPAQHSINITFKGNQNISVYDVYGKKIISKKGFENISIDVSQFANGFYIIKSNNGVGRFTVNH